MPGMTHQPSLQPTGMASAWELSGSCLAIGVALAVLKVSNLAHCVASALQLVYGPMRMEPSWAVWAVAGGYGPGGVQSLGDAQVLGLLRSMEHSIASA